MSRPTTKEEVFQEIEALAVENKKTMDLPDKLGSIRFYKEQILLSQKRYHFMAYVELD
ncbi:MAG: hypothetical protein Q9198_009123, partial [Flavoplaca austrocitrina]